MKEPSRIRDLAISESGFVFDPMTGHTFTVNPTGLFVLRALEEGCTEEQAIERLQDSFDLAGGEDVARDVGEFVSRLREHGLVG